MTIRKTKAEDTLIVALAGRLDTMTSPELEAELEDALEGVTQLIFDMAELEYISSAGLRVILGAQKQMNRRGKMVVRNVSEKVMEVLELTGLSDILTIE